MKNFNPRLNIDDLFKRRYPQSTKNLYFNEQSQDGQRFLFTRLRQSKSKNNIYQEQPFKKIPGITSINSVEHSPQKQQEVTFRGKLAENHNHQKQLKSHIKKMHQSKRPCDMQHMMSSEEWAILVQTQLNDFKKEKAAQIAQIHIKTKKSIPTIMRQKQIQLQILIDTILDRQYRSPPFSSTAQNPSSMAKKVLKSGSTYADSAISSDKRIQSFNRFSLCNNLLQTVKQFEPLEKPQAEGTIQLTFGNRNHVNTQQSTPGETMRSVKQFSNNGSSKRSNTPKRTIKLVSNNKYLRKVGQQQLKSRRGRQAQVSEFNIGGQTRRSSSKRIKQKIMRVNINPVISDFKRFD